MNTNTSNFLYAEYKLKKDWINEDGVTFYKDTTCTKDNRAGRWMLGGKHVITDAMVFNKDWFSPDNVKVIKVRVIKDQELLNLNVGAIFITRPISLAATFTEGIEIFVRQGTFQTISIGVHMYISVDYLIEKGYVKYIQEDEQQNV